MEIIDKAAGKVRNTLIGMRIPELLSSLGEDYTKRFLESKYDQLAKTKLFQSLKNRSQKEKLLIEFAFYVFNSFLKQNTSEATPFRAYFRGIATDFFPEMGKRLINGDTPEGKEVIELAYDQQSKSYVHAPSSPTKQKQPGFVAGFMSVADKRIKKSLEEK